MRDISQAGAGSGPWGSTVLGDRLFLVAHDGTHGSASSTLNADLLAFLES